MAQDLGPPNKHLAGTSQTSCRQSICSRTSRAPASPEPVRKCAHIFSALKVVGHWLQFAWFLGGLAAVFSFLLEGIIWLWRGDSRGDCWASLLRELHIGTVPTELKTRISVWSPYTLICRS